MSHGTRGKQPEAGETVGESIAAGRSAREVADGAASAAEDLDRVVAAQVLERKAAYARRRAASFRQGAEGECD